MQYSGMTSPHNLRGEKRTSTLKMHLYCKLQPCFKKIDVCVLEYVLDEAESVGGV